MIQAHDKFQFQLLDAVQLAIQGTLSIKLVNPVTLQNILRNVTLHLPHNYELIAGTDVQNLHLYYSLTKVSVIANAHYVNIVLSIPLKSANRYFSLFRIMTLPTYVAPDKFVQIQTDYVYFGIQRSQRGYILLSEAYINRCKRSDITICPADTPVYDTHTLTCESSLFFQNTATHHPCRRKLLISHQMPTFYRNGMTWIFHFPTPHRVTLHCRNDNGQVPRTLLLSEAGILHDIAECYVTSDGFQTLPELHGASQAKLDMPQFFLPNITVVTAYELQQLQSIKSTEVQKLDNIHTRLSTLQQTFDMDSLLHIHHTSRAQESRTNWVATILSTAGAVVIMGVLCLTVYLRFGSIPCAVYKPNAKTENPSLPLETVETENAETDPRVVFKTYAMQSTN
jgi:hypothetical protein